MDASIEEDISYKMSLRQKVNDLSKENTKNLEKIKLLEAKIKTLEQAPKK